MSGTFTAGVEGIPDKKKYLSNSEICHNVLFALTGKASGTGYIGDGTFSISGLTGKTKVGNNLVKRSNCVITPHNIERLCMALLTTHPNLASTVGVSIVNRQIVNIVYEVRLSEILAKGVEFQESAVQYVVSTLCSVVKFLDDQGLQNPLLDIRNIYFDARGNLKVSNYAQSHCGATTFAYSIKNKTDNFVAPERLSTPPLRNNVLSANVAVYHIGIVMMKVLGKGRPLLPVSENECDWQESIVALALDFVNQYQRLDHVAELAKWCTEKTSQYTDDARTTDKGFLLQVSKARKIAMSEEAKKDPERVDMINSATAKSDAFVQASIDAGKLLPVSPYDAERNAVYEGALLGRVQIFLIEDFDSKLIPLTDVVSEGYYRYVPTKTGRARVRATFDELCSHPWVASIGPGAEYNAWFQQVQLSFQ